VSGPTFVCDYITGYSGTTPAKVKFGVLGKPQCYMIDDTPYDANFTKVQDIGVCSKNKYDRISTGDFLFYVRKGSGQQLLHELNKVRSKYVNRSTSQLPTKDFLNDYLPNGQDYFEVTYTANIQGVSYNYEGNTRKIISGLPIGSPLTLRLWPDSPDDDHAICVFTPDSKQIGYLSLPDNWNPINAELRKQMQFGIPFTASVAEKGIVQDTDIWWCRVEIKYNVPYPRGSSMTYINSFGGAYHARRGCCHAEWEVPMYWAEKCAMHPCKRCHKAENK
jgi:hypothetical protein